MNTVSVGLLLFAALFCATGADQHHVPAPLFVVEGHSGRVHSWADGADICPRDHAHGVNFMCIPPPGEAAHSVVLYLDTPKGKVFGTRSRAKTHPPAPTYLFGYSGSILSFQNWEDYQNEPVKLVCECKERRDKHGNDTHGFHWHASLRLSCPGTEDVKSTPKSVSKADARAGRRARKGAGSSTALQIRLLAAGERATDTAGSSLEDGTRICPKDIGSKGFSVICVAPTDATPIKFFVDGKWVRSENVLPFTISGDTSGYVKAWNEFPTDRKFTLTCTSSEGGNVSATLSVQCPESGKRTHAGTSKVPEEQGSPSDGATSQVKDVTTSKEGCVVIDARKTRLSPGWTMDTNGVWFQKNNSKHSIARAGEFPLSYRFTAPVTATYGFVIDMTTSHGTEHNDVWARFPDGGFRFNRHGVFRGGAASQGWVKIYHNMNKRAVVSSTVDFNPHSISTGNELTEGITYEVDLAGRSSKVQVHRILMFPCDGQNCHGGSRTWVAALARCAKA